MGLVLVTPPSALISTADAKLHCRVDETDPIEDAMIDGMVAAAVDQAEQFLCRPLLTSAYRYTFDWFPGQLYWPQGYDLWRSNLIRDDQFIRLPIGGVRAISEIGYIDTDGNAQVMDASAYRADFTDPSARIAPAYQTAWPRARAEIGACYVNFTAGYGDAVTAVPPAIIAAVKLILGHIYANRESVVVGTTAAPLPMGAEHLMWPHRVWPLRSG